MNRRALITGVTGQDGYYLAKLLTSQGCRVLGHTRDLHESKLDLNQFPISLISFDLRSSESWLKTIEDYQVTEIYHLAGVSFVPTSWANPFETIAANLEITTHILESMRLSLHPPRFFYAGSSEIFGQPTESPQREDTPLRPLNPYGVTKAASLGMIESYRKRYGLFACVGILFNHESPRRPASFVTRKITQAVAAISMGLQDRLVLGNLDVSRDWGYAADYVDCMVRMMQSEVAEDYVIGSGKLSSLACVVETAFRRVGLDWRKWVSVDPNFARPNDTRSLVADSSKAWRNLGWKASTSVESLVEMMVDHDVEILQSGRRDAA